MPSRCIPCARHGPAARRALPWRQPRTRDARSRNGGRRDGGGWGGGGGGETGREMDGCDGGRERRGRGRRGRERRDVRRGGEGARRGTVMKFPMTRLASSVAEACRAMMKPKLLRATAFSCAVTRPLSRASTPAPTAPRPSPFASDGGNRPCAHYRRGNSSRWCCLPRCICRCRTRALRRPDSSGCDSPEPQLPFPPQRFPHRTWRFDIFRFRSAPLYRLGRRIRRSHECFHESCMQSQLEWHHHRFQQQNLSPRCSRSLKFLETL